MPIIARQLSGLCALPLVACGIERERAREREREALRCAELLGWRCVCVRACGMWGMWFCTCSVCVCDGVGRGGGGGGEGCVCVCGLRQKSSVSGGDNFCC